MAVASLGTPVGVRTTSSGGVLAATNPNGSPTAGSLLVACLAIISTSNVTTAPAAPSGWTKQATGAISGTDCSVTWYTKPAAGGDAAWSATMPAFVTGGAAVIEYELTSANTTSPIDVSGTVTGTTATAITVTTSGNVTASGGYALVGVASFRSSAAGFAWTAGTGFTNDYTQTASARDHFAFDHKANPASGSTSSDAGTASAATDFCGSIIVVPVLSNVPISSTDTGSGSDAGEKVQVVPVGDTGAGVDAGTLTHATQSDTSTGTGNDAGESIHAAIASSDIGNGADAGEKTAPLANDAGTGTDAGESIHVTLSSTDAGTGNDVSATIQPPVQADAGTGLDAGSVTHETVSDADTGTGTDSNGSVATGSTPISSSDTGSGADASVTIGISQTGVLGDFTDAAGTVFIFATGVNGDFTNASDALIVFVSDTDTGSGADATGTTPIVLSDADAGTGNDAGTKIAIADSDQGLGDELLAWSVGVKDADTGTGTEVDGTHAVPIASSDTGTASELSSLAVTVNDADSSTVNDAEQVTHRTLSDTDAGSAIDADTITLTVSSTDAVTGIDASSTIAPSTGNDGTTATTEATGPMGIRPADTETGSADEQGHQGFFRFGDDSGSASEAQALSHVSLTSADSGSASERQDAEQPSASWHMLESASFSHAAVLSPGTGLESTVLYACRAATVALNLDAYSLTADDTDIGAWYSLRSAELSVTAGYISWSALAVMGNSAISGPDGAGALGLSIWREYMAGNPRAPVILSAPARDLHFSPELSWGDMAGGERSLTVVLYAVQLRGFSIDSLSYKQGVQFSYSGTAVPSSVDEAGSPLPGYYSNGRGLSIGRILSSPGAAVATGSTPALALFGQGT